MVSVYALLCAATLLRGECTTATAIDVIRMPDAANELACARDSMMTLASLAIRPQAGEYWKVICTHDDLPNIAASSRPVSIVLHAAQRDPPTWRGTDSADRD